MVNAECNTRNPKGSKKIEMLTVNIDTGYNWLNTIQGTQRVPIKN